MAPLIFQSGAPPPKVSKLLLIHLPRHFMRKEIFRGWVVDISLMNREWKKRSENFLKINCQDNLYHFNSRGQNTFPFDFSDKSTFSTDLRYLTLVEPKKIGLQFFKCRFGYFTDQNGNALKITYFAISTRKIDIFHWNFHWT